MRPMTLSECPWHRMPHPTCANEGALANVVSLAPGNDSGMSSQLSKKDTDNTPAHVIHQSSSRRAPQVAAGHIGASLDQEKSHAAE